MSFIQYVNTTAGFRKKARKSAGDDGGTVMTGSSGESKGTKATAASAASNSSGGSDSGASVFRLV